MARRLHSASGRGTIRTMSDKATWGPGSQVLAVDDTGAAQELAAGEYDVVVKGDGVWFHVGDVGDTPVAGAPSNWINGGGAFRLTINGSTFTRVHAICDTGETCSLVFMQPGAAPVAS